MHSAMSLHAIVEYLWQCLEPLDEALICPIGSKLWRGQRSLIQHGSSCSTFKQLSFASSYMCDTPDPHI